MAIGICFQNSCAIENHSNIVCVVAAHAAVDAAAAVFDATLAVWPRFCFQRFHSKRVAKDI